MLFGNKQCIAFGLVVCFAWADGDVEMNAARKGAGETYYVFLAGGNGDRLWPLSTDTLPKQLLPLGPEGTLLNQAIDRVGPLTDKQYMWISTTEKHAAHIRTAVGNKVGNILVEPGSRNTAPAILLCCMKIQEIDPSANVVFLPADAFIPKSDWSVFREFIVHAVDHAKKSKDIVLLGVHPTYPATGYGYIEFNADDAKHVQAPYAVTHFREKPSFDVAQQYLQEGNKLWNIGIFTAQAKTFIQEYKKAAPDMYEAVNQYINGKASYNDVPKDSIDYALMERSKQVSVLPVDFAWCDVGNIEVFLTLKQQYSTLNANYISIDAKNNLVDVPDRTVALVGVHDLCIVEVDGALLIIKRDQAEKVRGVVDVLRQTRVSIF
jgi:mannose-1-phosphate guanylyltransferase